MSDDTAQARDNTTEPRRSPRFSASSPSASAACRWGRRSSKTGAPASPRPRIWCLFPDTRQSGRLTEGTRGPRLPTKTVPTLCVPRNLRYTRVNAIDRPLVMRQGGLFNSAVSGPTAAVISGEFTIQFSNDTGAHFYAAVAGHAGGEIVRTIAGAAGSFAILGQTNSGNCNGFVASTDGGEHWQDYNVASITVRGCAVSPRVTPRAPLAPAPPPSPLRSLGSLASTGPSSPRRGT